MAVTDPDPNLGSDEIIVLDNESVVSMELGDSITVSGFISGSIKSNTVSVYLNEELLDSSALSNTNYFEFECVLDSYNISGNRIIVKGTSNGNVNSSVSINIIFTNRPTIARSLFEAYSLLKEILEDDFGVDTSEADGLESLIDLVGEL